MRHIRDPVSGRCAECERNGVDPAVLHNGIIYTNQTLRPQADHKVIAVRPSNLASHPPAYEGNSPRHFAVNPEKPASEAARSTASTASTSQVTFATQTSFANDEPQTPPSPRRERDRKIRDDSPRYSPDGSPNKSRYIDHNPQRPSIWYVGDGSKRPRLDRSRSPDRKRNSSPRDRTPSPHDRKREKREYDDRRRQERRPRNKKSFGSRCRRCCRVCRQCCSCRMCCMIFWVALLILLLLGALAVAIYFAITGAQNADSVQDVTLLKDPRYLIYGIDQPCRTTVITTTTTTTTPAPTTTTPVPTTPTPAPTTPTTTPSTTTLILCFDTTTIVVRKGSEFRNGAVRHGSTSTIFALIVLATIMSHTNVWE